MMLKNYKIKSEIKGKHILFLGAVHGNEPAGTQAMFKVIQKFAAHAINLRSGKVTFIPVCNPKAYEKEVRQIDENLNRVIQKWDSPKTYEQELACEIAAAIDDADIIIDLHSSHCPNDKPFIFSDYPDELADKICQVQNIEFILRGWPEIYAKSSDIKDLSTGDYAHKQGKTCITVECGYHHSQDSIKTAYYVIMNTLLFFDMIEGYPSQPISQKQIMMDDMIIKTHSGHLSKEYQHLDAIKKGEILAVLDDGRNIISPQDGFILLPNHNATIGSEWFYLGHML